MGLSEKFRKEDNPVKVIRRIMAEESVDVLLKR
jgi:hypothetical protein